MKIIEHVMLISYLGEKKKKWKGTRFSKDMLKSVTSQSLVSVYTFFSDSCFVKLRKVSAAKKKWWGRGRAIDSSSHRQKLFIRYNMARSLSLAFKQWPRSRSDGFNVFIYWHTHIDSGEPVKIIVLHL